MGGSYETRACECGEIGRYARLGRTSVGGSCETRACEYRDTGRRLASVRSVGNTRQGSRDCEYGEIQDEGWRVRGDTRACECLVSVLDGKRFRIQVAALHCNDTYI